MTKLPVVTYRDLRKVVELTGFRWIRRKGSHNIFQNPSGRSIIIPDHGSDVIVRPLLRKLLKQIGISIEEYLSLIEQI